MSAPHTNVETQEKQHRPALLGMGLSVLVALVLLAGLAIWVFANGNQPQEPVRQIDDRTGQVEIDPGNAATPSEVPPSTTTTNTTDGSGNPDAVTQPQAPAATGPAQAVPAPATPVAPVTNSAN